jgi:hypothetical protein
MIIYYSITMNYMSIYIKHERRTLCITNPEIKFPSIPYDKHIIIGGDKQYSILTYTT